MGFEKAKVEKPRAELEVNLDVKPTICTADGCYLPASMNMSGGGWMCRYHSFADYSSWARISSVLRNHRDAVMRLQYLNSRTPVELFELAENDLQISKMPLKPGEDAVQYAKRLAEHISEKVKNVSGGPAVKNMAAMDRLMQLVGSVSSRMKA